MPVPGFIAGVFEAHQKFGKLPWAKLFQPAIEHAKNGFLVSPKIIAAAKGKGVLHPEGKQIWFRKGQMLRPAEPLVQSQLAAVLTAVAADGPTAFYAGEFARHYVARAQADGGKLTLDDLSRWKETISSQPHVPQGQYRGHQVMSADLITYAIHLNEALDLKASGSAATNPDSVYKQIRIMEEVFLSTKKVTGEDPSPFTDPAYAKQRADFVLNSPRRKVSLDAIFNTCFLVVRDQAGNFAWGTHSINTPTSFGAGIVVDGVYASHAISREHVLGKGASAPGISTSYALFKEGTPTLIVGSPGYGFVHGPYQYGTGIVEWDLPATVAMNLPRFGLPQSDGKPVFEQHYDPAVFKMLDDRQISYTRSRPSTSTGLVGAMFVDEANQLHVVQDGRRSGFARAN
jgi:gamma-glutamyltranspeptidase/glutathione hydrolase